MEAPAGGGQQQQQQQEAPPAGLWARPPSVLCRTDVLHMAGLLGSSLRGLQEAHGPQALAPLVPQVVRVLELLEALVERRGEEQQVRGREALRALKSLHLGDERAEELEQKLFEGQKKEHLLQNEVSHLKEENQKLLVQLAENQSQDDSAAKEHELMLKLKEVVDRQRDEIRAQSHEIQQKNSDTEALQEQLDRFMRMNEDLRRKLSVVQVQLKTTLERKLELETLSQTQQCQLDKRPRSIAVSEPACPDAESETSLNKVAVRDDDDASASQPCFTKKEVQQILQERNELKTNLFLIQEELSYYQRELLSDERIPGLLLDGMKSVIKKQKKKIKTKMLGIAESSGSSDEEDGSWTQSSETDSVDSGHQESKIWRLFGQWYRRSSKEGASMPASGVWEFIDSQEVSAAKENEIRPEE